MIVYGDHVRVAEATAVAAEIDARLARTAAMDAGLARHAALAEALILLGELAQGVADCPQAGEGGRADRTLMATLHRVACALVLSWDSGFARLGTLPAMPAVPLPGCISLRVPEGYAFYALYPETVIEAARRLRLAGPPRVIGIRSIGTGLAAVAAAALGAPPPVTVRPVGHPFERYLDPRPALAERILAPGAHYVVVDEGPGLSGSSFAAVARWLEAAGVAPDRIAFLPSHDGLPGPEASPATRACWTRVQREAVPADRFLTPARVGAWAETVLGDLDGPPHNLGGGRWRALRYAGEEDWPAIQPQREAPTWLVHQNGEPWRISFVGLGESGRQAVEAARLLAEAGWSPEVRGAVHGLLVQRWMAGEPASAGTPELPARIGAYLAARARLLPAPGVAGASPEQLLAMAEANVAEALGVEAAERFARRIQLPAERRRAIACDAQMDAAAWLATPGGVLLKVNGGETGLSHDLIGPQPIEWTIAGAIIELALPQAEAPQLFAAITAGGQTVSRAWLSFLAPCYAAFRLGLVTMTADALGSWPAEAARNRALARRYRDWIVNWLGEGAQTSC